METPVSPLTGRKAHMLRQLPAVFLASSLRDYYGELPPPGACNRDYSLWECEETSLQFAWPAEQGNSQFYEWVGRFPSYYPGIRWEYAKVLELVRMGGFLNSKTTLLDVGAGRGDFLRQFNALPARRKFGLDFSEDAVRSISAEGFGAFRGTIDEAITAGFVKPSSLQLVTCFHCLEHVEQPVAFVASMLSVLSADGRLYISTPNSPMSFESAWFDVMNHPPHHLTRWNTNAYEHLVKKLGCRMRIFHPAPSLLRDTLTLFKLLRRGTSTATRTKQLKDIAYHPFQFAKCIARLIEHRHRHGRPFSNVILVEVTRS